jgi:hypothetical protein
MARTRVDDLRIDGKERMGDDPGYRAQTNDRQHPMARSTRLVVDPNASDSANLDTGEETSSRRSS